MADRIQRRELWAAPLCEATLILIAAVTAWLSRTPWIFTSLGPTAFELIETPERRSSKPYSVILGHLIGVLSGFAALWITHAFSAPKIPDGPMGFPRVMAVTLAAMLTVFGTMLAKATQPAAISTSLLVSLGTMQTLPDACFIMGSVLLMTVAAEPLRRWREHAQARIAREETSSADTPAASQR